MVTSRSAGPSVARLACAVPPCRDEPSGELDADGGQHGGEFGDGHAVAGQPELEVGRILRQRVGAGEAGYGFADVDVAPTQRAGVGVEIVLHGEIEFHGAARGRGISRELQMISLDVAGEVGSLSGGRSLSIDGQEAAKAGGSSHEAGRREVEVSDVQVRFERGEGGVG